MGQFSYAATFPDSPMLEKLGLQAEVRTLQELLTKWLKSKEKVIEKSSYAAYKSAVNYHILPELGSYTIHDVTLQLIRDWRESLIGELSNKTINNLLIPLRQSLQEATENGWIDFNPLNNLRNLGKTAPNEVDPFTFDEVQIILGAAAEGYEKNLWQFAIFTGLRCGELMPLKWSNVALESGLVHIRDNLVLGEIKTPKTTLSRRTLHLIEPALVAITKQFEISGQGDYVWLNPKDGKPITTHKQFTGIWRRLISRTGLGYKNPYSCRHTFASLML